eukprot:UN2571
MQEAYGRHGNDHDSAQQGDLIRTSRSVHSASTDTSKMTRVEGGHGAHGVGNLAEHGLSEILVEVTTVERGKLRDATCCHRCKLICTRTSAIQRVHGHKQTDARGGHCAHGVGNLAEHGPMKSWRRSPTF